MHVIWFALILVGTSVASVDALHGALASAIAHDTRRLLTRSTSAAAWKAALRQRLIDGHTAALLAGTADRLGVRVGGAALNARNLSRAERVDIARAVAEQLAYLDRFAAALDGLSDRQIAARAASYAASVTATYWRAAAPNLPFYPGDGQTSCLTHCTCRWEKRDDGGYAWVLGDTEHCDGCRQRAAGGPYAA